jgi:hypothetical protein
MVRINAVDKMTSIPLLYGQNKSYHLQVTVAWSCNVRNFVQNKDTPLGQSFEN